MYSLGALIFSSQSKRKGKSSTVHEYSNYVSSYYDI